MQRWFGGDKSSYLVLPRPLLESMPPEWQATFVTLVRQFQASFVDVAQAPHYRVEAGEWISIRDLPDVCLEDLGISIAPDENGDSHVNGPAMLDRNGLTYNSHTQHLFIPREDPSLDPDSKQPARLAPPVRSHQCGSSPVSAGRLPGGWRNHPSQQETAGAEQRSPATPAVDNDTLADVIPFRRSE